MTATSERLLNPFAVEQALAQVRAEREAQDKRWGEQNHADGTGPRELPVVMLDALWPAEKCADATREWCEAMHATGFGTWLHILGEEFFEAAAASTTAELKRELIQVAAVAVAWIEAIDRRDRTDRS